MKINCQYNTFNLIATEPSNVRHNLLPFARYSQKFCNLKTLDFDFENKVDLILNGEKKGLAQFD